LAIILLRSGAVHWQSGKLTEIGTTLGDFGTSC